MDREEDFARDRDAEDAAGRGAGRTVTVGWTVRTPTSTALWSPPVPYRRDDPKPASAKSVQKCPAAIDFDARHFVIPCPVDVRLGFEKGANGQLTFIDLDKEQSAVRPTGLANILQLQPQNEWRRPDRPLIQMVAPYVFVADEPCYVVQTPPYLDFFPTPRPGIQLGGRYPIHIWPRPLAWGFEWHDLSKPLILKRGEPWFYVHFETENPSARVRLVEQEMTEELETYLDSIIDVANYVNRTYSMFSEARRLRPDRLLKPKE